MAISSLRAMLPRRRDYINRAAIDSTNQSDMAMENQNMKLTEMGVDPSAGRYVMANKSAAIDAAANKASAMTNAGQMADQTTLGQAAQIENLDMQSNRDNWSQLLQGANLQLAKDSLKQSGNQFDRNIIERKNEDIAATNAMSLRLATGRRRLGASR